MADGSVHVASVSACAGVASAAWLRGRPLGLPSMRVLAPWAVRSAAAAAADPANATAGGAWGVSALGRGQRKAQGKAVSRQKEPRPLGRLSAVYGGWYRLTTALVTTGFRPKVVGPHAASGCGTSAGIPLALRRGVMEDRPFCLLYLSNHHPCLPAHAPPPFSHSSPLPSPLHCRTYPPLAHMRPGRAPSQGSHRPGLHPRRPGGLLLFLRPRPPR